MSPITCYCHHFNAQKLHCVANNLGPEHAIQCRGVMYGSVTTQNFYQKFEYTGIFFLRYNFASKNDFNFSLFKSFQVIIKTKELFQLKSSFFCEKNSFSH